MRAYHLCRSWLFTCYVSPRTLILDRVDPLHLKPMKVQLCDGKKVGQLRGPPTEFYFGASLVAELETVLGESASLLLYNPGWGAGGKGTFHHSFIYLFIHSCFDGTNIYSVLVINQAFRHWGYSSQEERPRACSLWHTMRGQPGNQEGVCAMKKYRRLGQGRGPSKMTTTGRMVRQGP